MKIFISIASYEDPGLVDTIKSAIDNASDPENLIFGICLQYENEPNLNFLPKKQKRILSYDPNNRPGVNRVRYILKSMMLDEDYFLQIDAHTKFDKNWDLYLINCFNWISLKKENIILSAHLSDSFQTNLASLTFKVSKLNEKNFNLDVHEIEIPTEQYSQSYYLRCNFIFTDNKTINQIEYDKHTQSIQEESYLSFYLYMKGYVIYNLNGYCPLIHDNLSYNKLLYGEEYPKQKNWGTYVDTWEELSGINMAYIYNDYSKFAIKDSSKKIEDFWSDIGLIDEYYGLKSDLSSLIPGGSENISYNVIISL